LQRDGTGDGGPELRPAVCALVMSDRDGVGVGPEIGLGDFTDEIALAESTLVT